MNIKNFSEQITGRDYTNVITKDEINQIKNANIAIVFITPYEGFDDTCYVTAIGAIEGRTESCDGYLTYFNNGDIFIPEEICIDYDRCYDYDWPCTLMKEVIEGCSKIKTVRFSIEDTYLWLLETTVPNAKFIVNKDGEAFSIGIVLDIKDMLNT